MAKEIELKLLLQPQDHNRLDDLMQVLNAEPQTTRRLENTYFDTPDLALNTARAALRLRHSGKGWVQTLKTSGSYHGAFSERGEWETPVDGPALQPDLLPRQLLTDELIQALQPQFTTHFTRRTWLYTDAAATIEIAADLGEVALPDTSPNSTQQKDPISELELELKQGDPQALFDLAKKLCSHLVLHPGLASKAERGLRLLRGVKKSQPQPAELHQQAIQQLNAWIQAHENWAFNAAEEELQQAQRSLLRLHALLVMLQRIHPNAPLRQARIWVKKLLSEFSPLVQDSWRDKSLQQLPLQQPNLQQAASWRVQQLGYAARRTRYRQIWQQAWIGQASLELMQSLYTLSQQQTGTTIDRPLPSPTQLMQAACAHLRFPRQPLHAHIWLQRYPALVRLELLLEQLQPEHQQDLQRARQLLQGIESLMGDVALQQQGDQPESAMPQAIKDQLEQRIKTQLLNLGRLAQALWTE